METVSCKRKMMHVRAATQKGIESLRRKQNNAKRDKTEYTQQTVNYWLQLTSARTTTLRIRMPCYYFTSLTFAYKEQGNKCTQNLADELKNLLSFNTWLSSGCF